MAGIQALGRRAVAVRADVSSQPDLDATEDEFDRSYAVNAKGAFSTLQKGAKVLSDGGRLIHIGSTTVAGAHPGSGLYSSSKAAPCSWAVRLAQGDQPVAVVRKSDDPCSHCRPAGPNSHSVGHRRPDVVTSHTGNPPPGTDPRSAPAGQALAAAS